MAKRTVKDLDVAGKRVIVRCDFNVPRKDGKITTPVRGASLIGKGAEILMKIDRVGRDMRMAQGMCGSLSGSVPTNVGQPMIRVSSITVGGRA